VRKSGEKLVVRLASASSPTNAATRTRMPASSRRGLSRIGRRGGRAGRAAGGTGRRGDAARSGVALDQGMNVNVACPHCPPPQGQSDKGDQVLRGRGLARTRT